ncbi:MAG: RND transporter [Melioribacteraceae bacterium]|nr:MAG: RND transporter [Melioribacteraceae bacterium]
MAISQGKKSKTKKRVIVFGLLAVIIVALVFVVLSGSNKEMIHSVQTEDVQKRTITQLVAATGNINPVDQVIITPEISGEIVELPVEEGDAVDKGQLLIKIKPEIYIAQVRRAKASKQSAEATLKIREASLEKVESDYNRIKGLFEKGLASDSQLEATKAEYLSSVGLLEAQKASVIQASESLKEAEEQLAKTTIYSPLTGTVTKLNVELGERVLGSNFSQGTNIMTVADLSRMEAIVEVDENDVVLVSEGDVARIEIDAFGEKKFNGIVTQIGNSALSTGMGTQDEVVNFEVKIELDQPDNTIRPGMSCDADIETETRTNVLSVPIQSVTARMPGLDKEKKGPGEKGDSVMAQEKPAEMDAPKNNKPVEAVFIASGNEAKIVYVETGISDDTYMEIISGLSDSSKVISGPYRAISKELEHGSKIMVQSKGGFGKKGEN